MMLIFFRTKAGSPQKWPKPSRKKNLNYTARFRIVYIKVTLIDFLKKVNSTKHQRESNSNVILLIIPIRRITEKTESIK